MNDFLSLQSYHGCNFRLNGIRWKLTSFAHGVAPWQRDCMVFTVAFAFIILMLHSRLHTDVVAVLGIWFGTVTPFPLPVSSWHAPQVHIRQMRRLHTGAES